MHYNIKIKVIRELIRELSSMFMMIMFALFLCLGMFMGVASICAFATAQYLSEVVLGSTKREVERITTFTMILSTFFLVLASIFVQVM